ncbi:MAG: DUF2867 domain-containing protein [Chromatiales bacterium]|nr:DUF2867 domain-containing protein [Chromatiales bacterium]
MAAALEAERAHTVAARWTEGALMFRGYRHDYAFYAKRAARQRRGRRRRRRRVWRVRHAIGGDDRLLLRAAGCGALRECDRLARRRRRASPRGRRHPTELRVGDTHRLLDGDGARAAAAADADFGMRAPGAGVLEFEHRAAADARRTRVTVTAYWHPQGVWGLLYWYAFAPSHFLVFNGMAPRGRRARRGRGAYRRRPAGYAGQYRASHRARGDRRQEVARPSATG